MKKGDYIWTAVLAACILILVIPSSREAFMIFSKSHPYLAGFIKFFILATMGDLLGTRYVKGDYVIPKGLVYRALVWGFMGMMISLVFTVYMEGAGAAQKAGILPLQGSNFSQAFFGSAIMNLTFGPMLMAFHKFMDLFIDMKYENVKNVTLSRLVDRVDWHTLVEFSFAKACVFFWIPAHTIVFLLPSQYRVLASAFLSIVLGIIIAISKKDKPVKTV
nr:hypothetical protein [Sedimentibacter sp.]